MSEKWKVVKMDWGFGDRESRFYLGQAVGSVFPLVMVNAYFISPVLLEVELLNLLIAKRGKVDRKIKGLSH